MTNHFAFKSNYSNAALGEFYPQSPALHGVLWGLINEPFYCGWRCSDKRNWYTSENNTQMNWKGNRKIINLYMSLPELRCHYFSC